MPENQLSNSSSSPKGSSPEFSSSSNSAPTPLQGTWKCLKREGDENILKLMNVPDDLIQLYKQPVFNPIYKFNFDRSLKNMVFTETLPKLQENVFEERSQIIDLNEDNMFNRPGKENFRDEYGFSQSWCLVPNENTTQGQSTDKLQHNFSKRGYFSITTEYELVAETVLVGTSKSDCGVRSQIILEKIA